MLQPKQDTCQGWGQRMDLVTMQVVSRLSWRMPLCLRRPWWLPARARKPAFLFHSHTPSPEKQLRCLKSNERDDPCGNLYATGTLFVGSTINTGPRKPARNFDGGLCLSVFVSASLSLSLSLSLTLTLCLSSPSPTSLPPSFSLPLSTALQDTTVFMWH
jgi:hypothetical protein